MQTVALIVFFWIGVAVAAGTGFSMYQEKGKVFMWKEVIANELSYQFNVTFKEGFKIVDEAFPLTSVWYKTELMDSPKAIALQLFYHRTEKNEWKPHHFMNRIFPDVLYQHPSWGGIVVEA